MMRRYLTLAVAVFLLGALTAAGLAIAKGSKGNKPVHVQVGELELTFNGGFSPTVLSRTVPTPISLDISGKIVRLGPEPHPPALKEFVLETDKNGEVDVKGLPTCAKPRIESVDTHHAELACGPAIIGRGTTDVGIKFPDQGEIPAHSKLLLFNGGAKGGVTTFYVHAYLTVPAPAAVVTTVKITKIHNGRYGTKSVASIPPIAGGSGSVKAFTLDVNRKFTYKGKKMSVLTLKCPDGKIQARGEAIFADGTKAKAEVIRPCTPRK
jgi:hypothetical protein